MEGSTYVARWKNQGDKFVVFLDSDKSIKAADINFETACEELCLLLCEKFSDGEAVLNLLRDAPQPSGASRYSKPALVVLGWNESAVGDMWQVGLFEYGYCSSCKVGIGERTDKRLKVDKLPKGNIGSFNQVMFTNVLVSGEFVSLLTEEEITRLGLQEVVCTKRVRRTLFEVTGKPTLKQVGVKAGQHHSLSSWQCKSCGHKSFSCTHPEMPDDYRYTDFISMSDLPAVVEGAFVIVDNMNRKRVCMPLRRWKCIQDHKEAKGIIASRIYVLPEAQIERDPRVRIEVQAN